MPTGMQPPSCAPMTIRRVEMILGAALIICVLLCSALHAQEMDSSRIEVRQNSHNLWEAKNDIRKYRNSGQWDRDIETIVQQARARLDNYDPRKKSYAIVLDIDETSISNYPLMEEMDFAFESSIVEPGWEKWIKEARAPAIAAMLNLYKEAKNRGFHVFFITGRPESDRAGTERLLKNTGYDRYDGLFMRTPGEFRHSVSIFKTAQRKKLTEKGHAIILNVGDQESDLVGGYGTYTVKIPNPMYFIP